MIQKIDKFNRLEDNEEYVVEEQNPNLLKDNELFKQESYIPHPIIRVKRVNLPKGEEEWKIFKDKEVALVLKGSRFTNKQKEYLRTLEGFQYIIDGFKKGWDSANKFKSMMQIEVK